VEEQVADQVVQLMEDLREGLRSCQACAADAASALVLSIVAELIDEASDYELVELCSMFPKRDEAVPAVFAAASSRASPEVPVGMQPEMPRGQLPSAANTSATEAPIDDRIDRQIADGAEPEPEAVAIAVADKAAAVEATAALIAKSQAASLAKPEQPVISEGGLAPETAPKVSPEDLMQEAVSLASAAAAEGRQALASLPPIPPIAAVERTNQAAHNRQAELFELVEAQAQLRHDLEKLQVAKMRLQQARRVHEEKKSTVTAGVQAMHCSNGVGSEAAKQLSSLSPVVQAPSNGQAMPRSRSR